MSKASQTTKPADKPSLADYITPDIEAAFEAKAHLLAAWDLCNALLMNDEHEKNSERVNKAFGECACIVDDCMDEAMTEAAQRAGDAMRKRSAATSAA